MAAKTKDMTKGSPFQLLLVFALPLMVGNIFQQLYTVVDTMIVGQVLGVSALAALLVPMLMGSDGIFYAEIAAWMGADVILITAYYVRMHRLSKEH